MSDAFEHHFNCNAGDYQWAENEDWLHVHPLRRVRFCNEGHAVHFIVEKVTEWEDDRVEKLLSGMVKWDGCSHFYYGDEDGYVHLCGLYEVESLQLLSSFVFRQAFEIMGEAQRHGWDCAGIDEEFMAKRFGVAVAWGTGESEGLGGFEAAP